MEFIVIDSGSPTMGADKNWEAGDVYFETPSAGRRSPIPFVWATAYLGDCEATREQEQRMATGGDGEQSELF
ncbi:MAG: hypothetical protein LBT62_07555 [Deltaproteobacteria bacterium]|jgi:hypothetical protein|nr:hypothetical protein [Deltaproteobacteria bacterium]